MLVELLKCACVSACVAQSIGELICKESNRSSHQADPPEPRSPERRDHMSSWDRPRRRDRSGSAPAVRTTRQVLHSTGLEKGIRPHQLYRGKPSSSPGVRNGLILLIAFLFVFGEGLPS